MRSSYELGLQNILSPTHIKHVCVCSSPSSIDTNTLSSPPKIQAARVAHELVRIHVKVRAEKKDNIYA